MVLFDYEGNESYFYTPVFILENYGWYILILVAFLLYVYQKLKPSIVKYQQNRENERYSAQYHKNPDLFAAQQSAQQQHVERLQQMYQAQAAEYQKRKEEREAKKREEWLAQQPGYRLGGSSKENKSLKPEYNPLMGDTSGRSYTPKKKSPCSGGGCGR